jgi:hypothetical protein
MVVEAESDFDPEYQKIASKKIGDRTYDLVRRNCSECHTHHYSVYRWCGPSFACYRFPHDLDLEDFREFVDRIDEELLKSSADMLDEFHRYLVDVNCPHGIDYEPTLTFLLTEYARQRLCALDRLGLVDLLMSTDPPKDDAERAVRLAFELGAAIREHTIMKVYEDYFWAGMAVEEWRDSGLPKAREERLKQGMRSRNAILAAAQELYVKRPELIRNDTETAREIQKLELPELQKGRGQQLSIESITKHLRTARKTCAA